MPTFHDTPPQGDNRTDAYSRHYGSLDFVHDNMTFDYTQFPPSNPVTTPVLPVPRNFLNNWNQPSPEPIAGYYPFLPAADFQRPPMSRPTLQLNHFSPGVDYVSIRSSSSRPPSSGDSLPVSPTEAWNQTPLQPTAPLDQPPVFTVPLTAVEFPSNPSDGEVHFFQCLWRACGVWITSDKEELKRHFKNRHRVFLSNTSAETCCEWSGCSKPLQMGSLRRHIDAHLGLQWQCSVCKQAYTRPDSVTSHAHRHARCQLACAVSIPSEMAYKVEINRGSWVTLTKILQT
ncbi:hypothetical protein BS17DRAFT_186015 [Gyrodon lividus]|nr:hypothetical protein BS17DRAFT_186015 [Gyrodon lividus]